MSWETVELSNEVYQRGLATIRFNKSHNCNVSKGLQKLLKDTGGYLLFSIGKDEHAGLISFQETKTHSPECVKLTHTKKTQVCSLSARSLAANYGLHKKRVVFKKEGDRFVGKLPNAEPEKPMSLRLTKEARYFMGPFINQRRAGVIN